MESSLQKHITPDDAPQTATASTTNQLFIPENLDLSDDPFRMGLEYISVIGENVTIDDRDMSTDSVRVGSFSRTPGAPMPTPDTEPPETPLTPPNEKSPPITDTPKLSDASVEVSCKPQNLLKLSLTKKVDTDVFVKPSPVAEVMSPAKMLQFEVDLTTSATPTMKRAAIDFDFFNKNNFEEYFDDVPNKKESVENVESNEKKACEAFRETPVIVKADTVRHEIGYGRNDGTIDHDGIDQILNGDFGGWTKATFKPEKKTCTLRERKASNMYI